MRAKRIDEIRRGERSLATLRAGKEAIHPAWDELNMLSFTNWLDDVTKWPTIKPYVEAWGVTGFDSLPDIIADAMECDVELIRARDETVTSSSFDRAIYNINNRGGTKKEVNHAFGENSYARGAVNVDMGIGLIGITIGDRVNDKIIHVLRGPRN